MNTVKIQFLGASGTVTGSKFYLETPELNLLVDCGMFQGLKELRQVNWMPLPIDVSKIDLVLLTHGHLDHTGYLPRLVKEGFTVGGVQLTGIVPGVSVIILGIVGSFLAWLFLLVTRELICLFIHVKENTRNTAESITSEPD